MAAKRKPKSKPAAKASKKPAVRKKASVRPKRSVSPIHATVVRNHPFAPGAEVGFYFAHTVGVERSAGREPFGTPLATAKVKADGKLEVSGLKEGQYCAVAEVGSTYRYLGFGVK
jgi:hypothetical protein